MSATWRWIFISTLACAYGIAALAAARPADAAQAPPDNGSGPNGLKGYKPPPAIPGYDPSTDPRDFTGVWRNSPLPGQNRFEIAPGMKLNEKAQARAAATVAKIKETKATSLATPLVMCRPTGINQALVPVAPVYVLQNEREMVFIVTDEIRNVRHVYFETAHPKDLKPSYGGHSIARWEGNTLLIDTIGFNDRGQLVPTAKHSDQMHLVERITKSADGKTLDFESWFEDPEVLAAPVAVKKRWTWLNGQQPLEFDCEENPREDNFADMLFEGGYLKPICIQHEGKGDEPSKVICKRDRE